jgi:hypothetical protein
VIGGDPKHAPPVRLFTVNGRHAMFEQDVHAGVARGRVKRLHQPITGGSRRLHTRIGGVAGLDHRPVHHRAMQGAQRRNADFMAAAVVRRPLHHLDPVREQEFERRRTVVGEGANDLAVVITVWRKAVGHDDRPIGQVPKQQIGRILDAVFLLIAGAGAERQVATAGDGMAADVILGLDYDHRRAGFTRHDRGRKARRARSDYDYVGGAVPYWRRTRFFHVYQPLPFAEVFFFVMAGLDPATHPHAFGLFLKARTSQKLACRL